jgi:enoyl-CoA hydratase/carnithine racemase
MSVLKIERPRDGVALLTLNRPDRLNALNQELVQALTEAFASITDDDSVRVVVLTGEGRGFCAGLDLRDFGPSAREATTSVSGRMQFQEMMGALPAALRALPQPVIAAINGPAFGGGLALCLGADIRICSTSASFGNAAILIGLSGAEMGMSYHLPRIVGTSVAADWMLTGRTVSSDEASRHGLVSERAEDDALVDRALEIAEQIAANAPLAVRMTKRALQVNTDATDLDASLELENRNQVIASMTEESTAAREKWSSR